MTTLRESWLPWLTRQLTGIRAQHLHKEPRQSIYCVNHTSHLDTLLVLAALPANWRRQTRPVVAAGYWGKSALRRFLTQRIFRAVLLDRQAQGLNPLSNVIDALQQGDSLIYFPEGTRGPGGALQSLQAGVYYLARAFPQVDIVPVNIQGSHRILPKGASLPRPATCSVAIGQPLWWEGEGQEEFLKRLRTAMEHTATEHTAIEQPS